MVCSIYLAAFATVTKTALCIVVIKIYLVNLLESVLLWMSDVHVLVYLSVWLYASPQIYS